MEIKQSISGGGKVSNKGTPLPPYTSETPGCFTEYVEDVGPVQVEADLSRQRKRYDRPQLGSWGGREKTSVSCSGLNAQSNLRMMNIQKVRGRH